LILLVHRFELSRRHMGDRSQQPAVVEPGDPFEWRELDLFDAPADRFGRMASAL
jgi:hypothetical protein